MNAKQNQLVIVWQYSGHDMIGLGLMLISMH